VLPELMQTGPKKKKKNNKKKKNLDVNAEKTNISLCLRSFKNVEKFIYVGTNTNK
jgi:hypothetical protein